MEGGLKWVALWSGQGGQRVEHVERLRSVLAPDLREAWERALVDAGAPAGRLDEAAITRNRVAQPTLVAFQLAAWAALGRELPPPAVVAGYSIGEIAACAAAGGLDAADAVALAATRAGLMDEAADAPSGLAAVLGLASDELAPICERHGAALAIRNGPRHFVIGGPRPALEAVIRDASAAGATRAWPLPVTTPAHTRFVESAVPRFAAALAAAARGPLRVPMLSAIDASRLRSAQDVVSALSRQLATMLDWEACMDAVAETQPDAVVEIGPGNALARMLAEAAPHIPVRSLDDFRDPAAAIAWAARQRRRA